MPATPGSAYLLASLWLALAAWAIAIGFPYLCSLRSRDGSRHICGASLITPQLAITAAYCVTPPYGVRDPLLWCAPSDLLGGGGPPGSWDVLQTVRTARNEQFEVTTYCNDIALLELNASAVHAEPIGRGTLQPGPDFPYPRGYQLTAVGWGLLKPPTPGESGNANSPAPAGPSVPHFVDLPFVPFSECNAPGAYDGAVDEAVMFCAGNATADACSGDSGGPVVDRRGSDDPRLHVQAGIVSWGAGCARPGFPGVYTRLDAFSTFIEQYGYCACTSTGLSGGADTGEAGCSVAVAEAERQAGLEGMVAAGGGAPPGAERQVDQQEQLVPQGCQEQTYQHREDQEQGQAQGSQHACYVVDPARCPYILSSRRFPRAALAPCNPATNLTQAGSPRSPQPAAERHSSSGTEGGSSSGSSSSSGRPGESPADERWHPLHATKAPPECSASAGCSPSTPACRP